MARGWHAYTTGELVETADINDKFVNQGVMYFADSTARDAAITSPVEGMHAYLAGTDVITYHDGAAWQTLNDKWIPKTVVDAKGDLLAGTASDTLARLAVGTDGQVLEAASSEAAGVRWATISVLDRAILGGFGLNEPAAGVTAAQMYRVIPGATVRQRQIPAIADRAGSVIGVTVVSHQARTGGTLTVEVYIDGVATGLTAVLDATNTQYSSGTQNSGLDTFAANGRIDVRLTTDGAWAPSGTANIESAVTIQYD